MLALKFLIEGAYISETCEKDCRRRIGIFQCLHGSVGFIMSNGLGYFSGWRATCLVMAGVSLLSSFFALVLPETPYWLIEHDMLEDAE